MKYLLIFAAIFVILSTAIVVQETSKPNSSSEVTEMVEQGGKIIDVNLSDGVTGSLIQD